MTYVEISKNSLLELSLHELFSECYDKNTDKALLYSESLPEAFFDISSKVAGEMMQKLANYRVKTAVVLNPGQKTSKLFFEMASDSSRFGIVRFFENRETALQWLKTQ